MRKRDWLDTRLSHLRLLLEPGKRSSLSVLTGNSRRGSMENVGLQIALEEQGDFPGKELWVGQNGKIWLPDNSFYFNFYLFAEFFNRDPCAGVNRRAVSECKISYNDTRHFY